jgi:hypothetical protein
VIINMIDGIKSFDAAIDRALQLSNHVQKEEDMNKIESVLGYELETNTEGGVFLQSEELQKLNANLASNDQEVVSTAFLDKVEAIIKDQDAKIAALENTVTALAKNVVTYAEFEQFKAEAATAPTEAFSAEDPAVQVVDAADELDRITREAAEAGATLRVE